MCAHSAVGAIADAAPGPRSLCSAWVPCRLRGPWPLIESPVGWGSPVLCLSSPQIEGSCPLLESPAGWGGPVLCSHPLQIEGGLSSVGVCRGPVLCSSPLQTERGPVLCSHPPQIEGGLSSARVPCRLRGPVLCSSPLQIEGGLTSASSYISVWISFKIILFFVI